MNDDPMMCAYCRIRPAVEWSDQGRAQCETCSPSKRTDTEGEVANHE